MSTPHPASLTTPADMSKVRGLARRFFTDASALPVSCVLGGELIRGIPAAWQPRATTRRIDANISETVFEGADPRSGLRIRVECTEYRDHAVIEWVAWLSNAGDTPTPLIQDLRGLDASFAGAAPVLHHCNGDFYSEDGYTPQATPLRPGATLAFAPRGGRPCDGAFPYYRIAFDDGGLALAIGWPAQWSATFTALGEGARVQAGQELTRLRLMPGERIRTPRITVLAWSGDAARAVNLWRRWYLAHVLPRPDGRPLQPMLACAATDEGEEFTAATEANQLHYIARFKQRGIDPDVWWIDAGWYPCYNAEGERKWWRTGSWEPDPERFPKGFKPVSDGAATAGADLLVWFEPERVQPGTRLEREHPEWLLRAPGNDNGLLDLGIPAARQWLTDHVCALIAQGGIKIYRQDFNFPPLAHWRSSEADDRQGMHENLHVQGYLQYWDDLLARNPGLWIDSCSSGGRRNDLETLRRSVPLHYTDYGYGEHPVKLAFHRTMYEWIPYFKECTLSWDVGRLDGSTGPAPSWDGGSGGSTATAVAKDRFDVRIDSYSYHCGMAAMLFATLDIRRDDYDFALARTMIAIWRRAAERILFGDYHPHTPFHRSAAQWVAWQFDSPETERGLVQAIRLPGSADETLTIQPRGLRADARYRLENQETGEVRDIAGEELMGDGFTFALAPRSGAIWFYQRLPAGD